MEIKTLEQATNYKKTIDGIINGAAVMADTTTKECGKVFASGIKHIAESGVMLSMQIEQQQLLIDRWKTK